MVTLHAPAAKSPAIELEMEDLMIAIAERDGRHEIAWVRLRSLATTYPDVYEKLAGEMLFDFPLKL